MFMISIHVGCVCLLYAGPEVLFWGKTKSIHSIHNNCDVLLWFAYQIQLLHPTSYPKTSTAPVSLSPSCPVPWCVFVCRVVGATPVVKEQLWGSMLKCSDLLIICI